MTKETEKPRAFSYKETVPSKEGCSMEHLPENKDWSDPAGMGI